MATNGRSKSQKDPVCGMNVNPENTPYKTEYHQREYSFCCQQCLSKFQQNPTQFAK